jgi:hypothetical protein
MITIFCDFCLFSAKKLAFFSKTNVMITIFPKTISSLSKKRQFFAAKFFGENILKIITSVPGDGKNWFPKIRCNGEPLWFGGRLVLAMPWGNLSKIQSLHFFVSQLSASKQVQEVSS